MSNGIEFKSTDYKDWKVFAISGRLDTVTAPDAEKAGAAVLAENNKIALDMTAMDYISSAGLRVLLRLAKQAKKAKKNFVLFGASNVVKEVLEMSGMNMLMKIYEAQDDLP